MPANMGSPGLINEESANLWTEHERRRRAAKRASWSKKSKPDDRKLAGWEFCTRAWPLKVQRGKAERAAPNAAKASSNGPK